MRRIAQVRNCWKLTAAAAVLWCVSAAAADTAASAASGKNAQQAPAPVKPVKAPLDIDITDTYKQELQQRYAAQDATMAEAARMVDQKDFAKGVKKAESVRDELKLMVETVKGEIVSSRLAEAEALVRRLRFLWGRDRIRSANDAFVKGEMKQAMILAAEAESILPFYKKDADELRKMCQGRERSEKFQRLSALSVANPDLAKLREEVKTLLSEAKVLFENRRYPQALDKVEQVYLRDPFNMEAVALAGQIYRVFFTTGYYRHRADFELQSAYSNWQWVEPVFEAPETPKEINIEVKKDSRKLMSDKLNSAIMREYKYQKGDARGAIMLLQRYLKQNKLDIDIQHSINPDETAGLGTVSLDLRNVSVGDVLRYISLMSGLKYRIDPTGVVVGTSVETLYDRSYEIQPHVRNIVFANTSNTTDSGSTGGEPSTIFRKRGAKKDENNSKTLEKDKEMDEELKHTDLTDVKVTSDMFKSYLADHGIRFGAGSSVSYIQSSDTLVVKNTIENLDAISQLLREQNELQAPLILVETKCIEISETDMEELGFDWTLGDTNLNKNMDNNGTLVNPNKKGWMLGPGNNIRVNSEGERGSMNPIRTGFMDGSSSIPLINNLNIFPMLFGSHNPFGSDVPLNISLTVNALSQNTRTEVVSAPKIVALSGIQASARLTKTYHYPSDWDEFDIETDTSDDRVTIDVTRPIPQFDDEQEIGVTLRVTPTVTETGAINLDINFQVLGTNGVDEFTFGYSGTVNGRPVSETFTIWKPVITDRNIITNVDVYDGQTIVLAGCTDNRTVTRNDKIPFLGELPLIGRLFQAQSEKAERRNVLLFVTARKLGADGSIVNSRNQGIPDFNR